jgi:DNA-directed RNA polymerase sigma subunit (sigma70/sigma32)
MGRFVTVAPTYRQRKRHNAAFALPTLTQKETEIIQLRAQGYSYAAISQKTGVGSRKAWDMETAALNKLLKYIETQHFLTGQTI